REAILLFFIFRQQVKEKCPYTVLAERAGDELISGTMPAAAAAMGEENNTGSVRRHNQLAIQVKASERNFDFRFHVVLQLWHGCFLSKKNLIQGEKSHSGRSPDKVTGYSAPWAIVERSPLQAEGKCPVLKPFSCT